MEYEVVKRWRIPNGGVGAVILISPEELDHARMEALGETLRADSSGHRNAFVYVFIDREAAEMRDATATGTDAHIDDEWYNERFVAIYKKNTNTGYHEYEYALDGWPEGTDRRRITY